MVESSDITELEISEGETLVRIARQNTVISNVAPQVLAAPVTTTAMEMASPVVNAAPSEEYVIKSPMVGTFYRSAGPDSQPFVVEGQSVKKGDTLCIIEAMKLMNEIEIEYNGVVEKILVDNATALEYGQAMFVVKPV